MFKSGFKKIIRREVFNLEVDLKIAEGDEFLSLQHFFESRGLGFYPLDSGFKPLEV